MRFILNTESEQTSRFGLEHEGKIFTARTTNHQFDFIEAERFFEKSFCFFNMFGRVEHSGIKFGVFQLSFHVIGKRSAVNDLLHHSFRPEFLNRLDEIVFYKPLTKDNVTHIIDLMVAELNRRLGDKQLTVSLTERAKDHVIDSAYDPIYGARPLRRYLQHTVETLISRKIISGEVEPGDTLVVDCAGDELTVSAMQVQ